ncbi:SUR7/PalI family protein [Phanerochaete sordida]|uniref:SUR7/PalI family protein n=1 Tax=Phanerochaete sordida TaxID=48140 RepID=A0A9P3G435_9APHY|nr:SUR7/PalI family protein [Phanerochaete sordida]
MRGELCIGSATFLSLVALILLIFMHVGQISTSNVPRNIAMMKVNMTGFGTGLAAATAPDPVTGLYTDNASTPLAQHLGLRNFYDFGLYKYCAYVNSTHGTCSHHVTANKLQPYDAVTNDMPDQYTIITDALVASFPPTAFSDSQYLGQFSRAAYYLLLLGSIATGLALLVGLLRHALGFLASTVFAILGSLFLLIGSVIWTVIVKKAQGINTVIVPTSPPTPLGITVETGNGLWLAWSAFACLIVSVLPYMISCCTYRG